MERTTSLSGRMEMSGLEFWITVSAKKAARPSSSPGGSCLKALLGRRGGMAGCDTLTTGRVDEAHRVLVNSVIF
jgi:hypothetical protein